MDGYQSKCFDRMLVITCVDLFLKGVKRMSYQNLFNSSLYSNPALLSVDSSVLRSMSSALHNSSSDG